MAKYFPLFLSTCLILLLLTVTGCDKIGQKTAGEQNSKKGLFVEDSKIYPPRAGNTQRVKGTVARVERDVKTVWVQIAKSRNYTTLARRLSGSNRNDKKQEIRVSLEFVSPLGSVVGVGKFRKSWRHYVYQILSKELLEQTVLMNLRYQEKAKKFWGTLYKIVNTSKGRKVRNINLWMVREGLSYYIIEQGMASKNKEFQKAQELAKQQRSGLWKYQ